MPHRLTTGQARARVYLFPHAGGSAVEYAGWHGRTGDVELVALQPPGRAARFADPNVTDVRELAREAAELISTDLPFALFGHSFGALVAFETCRALRASGQVAPDHLWVSAFPAPDLIPESPALHTMPGVTILHELSRRFDAIPQEVMDDDELAGIVAEYVRADYEAMETYSYLPAPPLATPITVLNATDDDRREGEMVGWGRHTTGACSVLEFPGGHFYLRDADNATRICTLLSAEWWTHDRDDDHLDPKGTTHDD